jgi:hypothetical protein
MARPARLELATPCLEGRRSIQLSYGRLIHSKRFHALTTTALFRFVASGVNPVLTLLVREVDN